MFSLSMSYIQKEYMFVDLQTFSYDAKILKKMFDYLLKHMCVYLCRLRKKYQKEFIDGSDDHQVNYGAIY